MNQPRSYDQRVIMVGLSFFRNSLLGLLLLSALRANGQLLLDQTIQIKSISERWELADSTRRGTFRLTSYKPFYVTLGRRSSRPNRQPYSENPAYSLSSPVDYNASEAKIYLSFKTKVIQGLFGDVGDVWVGYSQVAHWQLYNKRISRAFRELNYEPELILNFPIKFRFLGFESRTIGGSFNHQSNGQDLPRSRSWNRVIFHTSFERKYWQITLRPWIRLQDAEDENPAITSYIGRGELTVVYGRRWHQIYLIATHPFSGKALNRGSAQLNWVFQLHQHLKGQLQLSAGYGETLIDYNHAQNTIGVCISFIDW